MKVVVTRERLYAHSYDKSILEDIEVIAEHRVLADICYTLFKEADITLSMLGEKHEHSVN